MASFLALNIDLGSKTLLRLEIGMEADLVEQLVKIMFLKKKMSKI